MISETNSAEILLILKEIIFGHILNFRCYCLYTSLIVRLTVRPYVLPYSSTRARRFRGNVATLNICMCVYAYIYIYIFNIQVWNYHCKIADFFYSGSCVQGTRKIILECTSEKYKISPVAGFGENNSPFSVRHESVARRNSGNNMCGMNSSLREDPKEYLC